MKLVFIADKSTAMASGLAGEVQALADNVVTFEDSQTLRREWSASGGRQAGAVIHQFDSWRGIDIQARRAFVRPEALLDVRVRQALAHSVDRQALNESMYAGLCLLADYVVSPRGQWAAAVQRGAVTYPYDLRRTEQLMREVGYEKGSDSILAHPSHGRFTVEIKSTASPDSERERAVTADGWRVAGFDFTQATVPSAFAQDLEVRSAYPGMFVLSTPGGDRTAVSFTPDNIPMPDNRWRGGNRSGWSHPEYTLLAEQFKSTLDAAQRTEQLSQMARLFSENVVAVSLYFRPQVWAHTSALRGPGPAASPTDVSWNIHLWELP